MAQVSLTINEQVFRVGCEEGQEEALLELADDLNRRIETFRSTFGEVGPMRLMIMAALEIGDELGESRQRLAAAEAELAELRDAQGTLEQQVSAAQRAIVDTLDAASERVERLTATVNAQSNG
jgi:cell division protein ZapA